MLSSASSAHLKSDGILNDDVILQEIHNNNVADGDIPTSTSEEDVVVDDILNNKGTAAAYGK